MENLLAKNMTMKRKLPWLGTDWVWGGVLSFGKPIQFLLVLVSEEWRSGSPHNSLYNPLLVSISQMSYSLKTSIPP